MHPSSFGFPDRILRALLVRGAGLWALTRLFGKAMLAAATLSSPVILPVWAIAMTASVVLIDLHLRHELTLFHNLGVTTWRAVLVGTVPAVLGELLLVMLMS